MDTEYGIGGSTITLHAGNLAESRAQVLVSSDDVNLSMGGGVSAALLRAAGDSLYRDARKVTPAHLGDVVVTSAGTLGARYVFHAVTLDWSRPDLPREALVRSAVRKAMDLLPILGCRSIAFPSIGSGVAGIPQETVAAEMMEALASALLDTPVRYAVELWLYDRSGSQPPEAYAEVFAAHLTRTLGLHTAERQQRTDLVPPEAAAQPASVDGSDPGPAFRARAAYEMLRKLDARRAGVEEQLVQALNGDSPDAADVLARCRSQLDELRQLRQGYEADLLRLTGADPGKAAAADAVFVSSTYLDLKPHRDAVKDVIKRLSFDFVGMEEFPPSAAAPVAYIRQQVERADLYLGILGMRYGFVDSGTGRSMTELEYEQALASGKQLLLFMMDRDAPITVDMVETDPEAYAKLLAFRNRLLKSHMCRLFTTQEDLVRKAEEALAHARG